MAIRMLLADVDGTLVTQDKSSPIAPSPPSGS
jgi:hypothetical protein